MDMWEILVPYYDDLGFKIAKSHHEDWDEKVCILSNGLMLHGISKGRYGLTKEKVIRVRIATTLEIMEKIRDITKEHYNQESVLFYKVGGPVYIG